MRKINKNTFNREELLNHLEERIKEANIELWFDLFYSDITKWIETHSNFLKFEDFNYLQYLKTHNAKKIEDVLNDERNWTNFVFIRKWRNLKAQQRTENYSAEKFRVVFCEKAQTLAHRALFLSIYEFIQSRVNSLRTNWNYDVSTSQFIQTLFNIKSATQVTMLKNFNTQPVNRQYPALIDLYQALAYLVATYGDTAQIVIKSFFYKHLKYHFYLYPEDNGTLMDIITVTYLVLDNLTALYYWNEDNKQGEPKLRWHGDIRYSYISKKL
ncbi:hypothetical protein ACX1NB_01370 [Mycoplasma sp. HF14]